MISDSIKLTDTTNTQSVALINIVDRNTIVWWGLLLTSVLLAVIVTPWGCLFWLIALAVDDVLLAGFGKSYLFDSQLRMRRNYQLINKNSRSKRVFISCLHQTHKPRTWKFYFHAYFMDKFYSGHYPFVDEGPLNLCMPWFEILNLADKTEDYRLK